MGEVPTTEVTEIVVDRFPWRNAGLGVPVELVAAMLDPRRDMVDFQCLIALVRGVIPMPWIRGVWMMLLTPDNELKNWSETLPDQPSLLPWMATCLWGTSPHADSFRSGQALLMLDQEPAATEAHICLPLLRKNVVLGAVGVALRTAEPKYARDALAVLALSVEMLVLPRTSLGLPSCVPSRFVTPPHDADTPPPPTELTDRQSRILHGMADGLTNRQIASRISFSESTVRQESMEIYRFFAVSSREDAVSAAHAAGLLDGHRVDRGSITIRETPH